jgi:hypothetical protein
MWYFHVGVHASGLMFGELAYAWMLHVRVQLLLVV